MRFIDLSKKNVRFVFFELDMWINRWDLDAKVEVLSGDAWSSCYSFSVSNVSTFHWHDSTSFYCNEEFKFFLNCSSGRQYGTDPEVTKLFFRNTLVSRNRIERLLREIEQREKEDRTSTKWDKVNFWKAEEYDVALID